ncbi:MAG: TauD/TfdA dioxygenase family protein [Alphaproteobacteria bacterium]
MSTQAQAKTDYETRELMPGFGVEVTGIDAAQADDQTRAFLLDCFQNHGALLLRGQSMTPDDMMAFGTIFGELEDHTQVQYRMPGYPKIYLLSNRDVDGKPIGSHRDGVGWHTDYSYKDKPVMCTMLYSIDVPEVGGDTMLADLCAAYDALPEEKKTELDPLILHHSYKYFMETREFGRQTLSPELEAENPDVFHPLIRTHPADGRKALWVSTGTVKTIVGMSQKDSLKLIDELVEFVTQDRFVFRHKWRKGDILVWDNRCTLHTGSLFDDEKYIRHSYRMWVKGDKPVGPATHAA